MKKALLIALLLIPFLGFSQTTKPIDGFLGIKFGSSRASVAAALAAKGGIRDKENSDAGTLAYKKLKLGHRSIGMLVVKFVDDKAFEADYIFDPGLDANTISFFQSLIADIDEVYGTGTAAVTFKEPYSDKDDESEKIVAIKNGEADYKNFWQSANQNTIEESIDSSLAVILTYQDNTLTDLAIKKQKNKEKSDY